MPPGFKTLEYRPWRRIALVLILAVWPRCVSAEPLPTPERYGVAPPARTPAAGETVAAPAPEFAQAETVVEVRISGNETTSTTQVASQITTRAGRPFDQTVVQKDVRKLASLGWFVDVKSSYETTPQGRIVIFQVVERPTIRYVSYLGNKKVSDKKLAKQTLLKVGGSVDPYSVDEGRRKIKDYYTGKGYNNVQVFRCRSSKAISSPTKAWSTSSTRASRKKSGTSSSSAMSSSATAGSRQRLIQSPRS
jgi:hypothetical protein